MADIAPEPSMNVTNVTQEYDPSRSIRENPSFLLALLFMIVAATSAIFFAGRRVQAKKMKEVQLISLPAREYIGTAEAAQFPVTGSCVLFGLYLAVKFFGKQVVNHLMSAYLLLASVAAVAEYFGGFFGGKKNIITGCTAVALGYGYWVTKHWILNNILAYCICVVAIETVSIKSFKASALMLCGLFFYDIFWVFGTDVMVTVAKSIEGPIKLLFPQDIFGDHEKKSLLGLGDIVIPGFFIAQMLRFSLFYSNGKTTIYFNVAIVAYILSLVNTMGIMVVFGAAQPALLYIVPWLLISILGTAFIRKEHLALLAYDEEEYNEKLFVRAETEAPAVWEDALWKARENEISDSSLLSMAISYVASLFGSED